MKHQANTSTSTQAAELQRTIEEIGLARFIGRVNSGVIPSDVGFRAMEMFVSSEKERPFLSKLTQVVLGRTDSYTK